ncbi:MAG: dTDP-4-dehydrorhamnose reductase [Bryobacteraceae bacterium]
MKVAVIGANGQLGRDTASAFEKNGDEVVALTHSDIEIVNSDSVFGALRGLRPALVVNTAAMHHVDNCEREPEKAFAVNAVGARHLAFAARDIGAVLVHVSTDYVFDGAKTSPYLETDCPRPLNVYGNSKLAGEYFIEAIHERHFVVRTSGLYGKSPCRAKGGRNFVELMLKLAQERGEVRVVNDERVSPTSTRDLARQIVALSRSEAYGLYHATAESDCSWYEFAQTIFDLTHTKVKVKVASADEFPSKVARPKYSVLDNRALKLSGLNTFGPWQDGLCDYLCVPRLCAVEQAQ